MLKAATSVARCWRESDSADEPTQGSVASPTR
jgi:hypothetical protein